MKGSEDSPTFGGTTMLRFTSLLCASLILSLAAIASAASTPSTQPSDAKRAFERFKSLAGNWEGHSSKGWTENLKVRVIAGGSCVIEESEFAHGADPQNNMVTMYHMDGDNLLLTHYCMARNQPRLRATEFSNNGQDLTFTFQDGTGMSSRDVGHMDKVVFHFDDSNPNAYRSQWTFYAKGKEQWMEEITYRRK
jgi:hypothetical protein